MCKRWWYSQDFTHKS